MSRDLIRWVGYHELRQERQRVYEPFYSGQGSGAMTLDEILQDIRALEKEFIRSSNH